MDRDSIFSPRIKGFLERQPGIKPKVTSYKSPWQNGVAERLVKSIRNELLNNVVVFSEDHLRRLMREYVGYYNKDRCHLSLNRDSPMGRKVGSKHSKNAKVKSNEIFSVPDKYLLGYLYFMLRYDFDEVHLAFALNL